MRIAISDNDMDFVLRLKGAIDDCFAHRLYAVQLPGQAAVGRPVGASADGAVQGGYPEGGRGD